MGLCIVISHALSAQTFAEWFRQNHTQLLYLKEQIAALQALLVTQENGYGLVKSGLDKIDSTEWDDFGLHEDHFASLLRPSPAVANDPKVRAIHHYCGQMGTAGEDIEMRLSLYVQPGLTSMSDAERLRGIDALYDEARTYYAKMIYGLELKL